MPRSRGSDMPQRQSPRAPLHLKTTACSEANSVHRAATVERSPKLEDRRSPRSPMHEKKRGTRVAELETKLGKAQEELKKLRDQLASAEAAKEEAQRALEEAGKQAPVAVSESEGGSGVFEDNSLVEEASVEHVGSPGEQESHQPKVEDTASSPATTDVFEVLPAPIQDDNPQEEDGKENKAEAEEKEEEETKKMIERHGFSEMGAKEEEKKKTEEADEVSESPEVLQLKAKLLEKEKEVEALALENESLRRKADEVMESIGSARAKEEELGLKVNSMEEELREIRVKAELLRGEAEAAEGAKCSLEAEMKKLRVQTEQWRKAAEAAAAVLAAGEGGVPPPPQPQLIGEIAGRKGAERCASMDKHLGIGFGGRGGNGFLDGLGSPLMAGEVEEKRRGAGIRMFGDLWKKKGQHK